MITCIPRLLLIAILTLLLGACATTHVPTPPPAPPIAPLLKGSETIAFYRLLFEPSLARAWGSQLDTLLRTDHFPYAGTEEFSWVANRRLRQQGYTVLGMESVVFGKNNWDQASLQLGATVEALQLQTLDKGAISARMGITWQLFDARRKRLHYTHATTGHTTGAHTWQLFDARRKRLHYTHATTGHTTGAHTAVDAVLTAFGDALARLFANVEFVAHTSPSQTPSVRPAMALEAAAMTLPTFACTEAPAFELPQDLEAVLKRVVTIRNGVSHGSGVIVSPDGHVLTAAHVVEGLPQTELRLRSALKLQANVLHVDTHQDIALLKLPGRGYPCLGLRLENQAPVGTPVYAIGTPIKTDLASSVAQGIVSAYRRKDGVPYLQTDAGINQGNSGGPLVDAAGRIVAIVSSKFIARGVEGLAFGVPIGEITRDFEIAAGSSRM